MSMLFIPNETQPQKAIVLKDSVYHSFLGEYFFGQTDMISYGGNLQAWGELFNPWDSKVNMFLNTYTISNFSNLPITVEGWLGAVLLGREVISNHVAAGNQSITPPTRPKVLIKSGNYVAEAPISGTYTFVRRVEPSVTLTKHDFQGMYIIPPGSSFALIFLSPGEADIKVKVAFGWWEEKRCD